MITVYTVLLSGLCSTHSQVYIQVTIKHFSVLSLSAVHYHFRKQNRHRLSLTGFVDRHSRRLNQAALQIQTVIHNELRIFTIVR